MLHKLYDTIMKSMKQIIIKLCVRLYPNKDFLENKVYFMNLAKKQNTLITFQNILMIVQIDDTHS